MRIQILSDLHLDTAPLDIVEQPDIDIVVLAGDIQRGLDGLHWAINTFSVPVIYVPGNHEYYEQLRPQFLSTLKQAANGTHVHVLDQDTVTIDGIDFFGATLWTDFCFYETPDMDMAYAQRNVLDFHIIEEAEEKLFSPQRSTEIFFESVQWLDTALRNSNARKRVVITHHAPSAKSVVPRFAGSPLNPAFTSRLEPFIEKHPIDLWIHGHMHTALDYELHGTRVICNPRGYQPYEIDNGFELNKIIDIDAERMSNADYI